MLLCSLWNRWDGFIQTILVESFDSPVMVNWFESEFGRRDRRLREETSRATRRESSDPVSIERDKYEEREKDSETKWKSPSKNQARASYLRANTHRWDYYAITHLHGRLYLRVALPGRTAASPFLPFYTIYVSKWLKVFKLRPRSRREMLPATLFSRLPIRDRIPRETRSFFSQRAKYILSSRNNPLMHSEIYDNV